MLGKLMKYEFKSTWKILVPANLLIVVMTFFACVTVRLDFFSDIGSDGAVLGSVIIMLTYVLSMFVALVGTAIYLIYHFYTSTYGDQGYLLHTLPVDKHHIIIAKVLVSLLWILLSSFLMYCSILFLFNLEEEIFTAFVDIMQFTLSMVGEEKYMAITIIMMFVAMIVEMLARVLKVAACISLGQLSSNHKLLVAFAYYFGIYIIQQIIRGCYLIVLGIVVGKTGTFSLGATWEFTLITGLIYSVAFYLITWHVMDKQLNLD